MRNDEQHARNADGTLQGGRKDVYSTDEVIEALNRAHGIVTAAARHLGCSARTVYRYVERYPEVKQAKADIHERLIDLAEGKLLSKINEGNMTAIIFFLKCQAKDRGYVERASLELSGTVGHTGPDLRDIDDSTIRDAVARLIRGNDEAAPQGGQ